MHAVRQVLELPKTRSRRLRRDAAHDARRRWHVSRSWFCFAAARRCPQLRAADPSRCPATPESPCSPVETTPTTVSKRDPWVTFRHRCRRFGGRCSGRAADKDQLFHLELPGKSHRGELKWSFPGSDTWGDA